MRNGKNISIAASGFVEIRAVSAIRFLRQAAADELRLTWDIGDRFPEFVRFLGWVHQIE